LQSNQAVLDQLEGALTGHVVHRAGVADVELRVDVAELILTTEELMVEAVPTPDERLTLVATVTSEQGALVASTRLHRTAGGYRGVVDPLPPGCYAVVVSTAGSMASRVAPVTSLVLVWDPA